MPLNLIVGLRGRGRGRCYLLAWVPHAVVGVADAGIDVNPEQSIAWLTDVHVGIRSVIHDG